MTYRYPFPFSLSFLHISHSSMCVCTGYYQVCGGVDLCLDGEGGNRRYARQDGVVRDPKNGLTTTF